MSITLDQVIAQWANSDSYINYRMCEGKHLIELECNKFPNQRDTEKINWINKQISNWLNYSKIHFNIWEFDSEFDAKKLLSLYYLKWKT